MRIIAGERRGHKFDGPRDSHTRPTSDFVREAIFNILGASVADRVVIDLFAGSGALGLEALSRGADRAIFVERDRINVGLIHRNLATLRLDDRATVRLADAYRWVRGFEPDSATPVLALIDPPYREFARRDGAMAELVNTLTTRLPAGSTIVLESDSDYDLAALAGAWDIRRYGGTKVALQTIEPAEESEDREP